MVMKGRQWILKMAIISKDSEANLSIRASESFEFRVFESGYGILSLGISKHSQ